MKKSHAARNVEGSVGVRAGLGPSGPPSAGGSDLVTNYYMGCSSFQLLR